MVVSLLPSIDSVDPHSSRLKARLARNPKTGEAIQVPAKRAPKFLPSKNFKEIVK